MVYASIFDAYCSPTFKVQLLICMIINFGVNFGIEYGSMSSWGKYPNPAAWPGIPAIRLDTAVGSCLALDMLLTSFAMGYFCTLLATGGTQKEVRDRKCDTLLHHEFNRGYWLLTPVPIRDLCLRSFAMGIYTFALVGVPSFLIAWASIGNGFINGYSYTVFKGLWCMFLSVPVYTLVFPAAIDKRNFPELEFEALLQKVGGGVQPPFSAPDDGGSPAFSAL